MKDAVGTSNTLVISGEILSDVDYMSRLIIPIVDGFQLDGVWQIIFDTNSVFPALPLIQNDILFEPHDVGLRRQGTIVTLSHMRDWHQGLGDVTLDFGLVEPLVLTAFSGELVVIPVTTEQTGTMQFSLDSDVSVKNYSSDMVLQGGDVGILLDARGRPLQRYMALPTYSSQYRRWEAAL